MKRKPARCGSSCNVLAYNLANFMRTLATPEAVENLSLTAGEGLPTDAETSTLGSVGRRLARFVSSARAISYIKRVRLCFIGAFVGGTISGATANGESRLKLRVYTCISRQAPLISVQIFEAHR